MIIPATALINGAQGTAHHLGGHAQWLLALPTTHIAGIQVIARSLVAGTRPVSVDRTAGFTPTAFLQGVSRLNHTFTATSLVPTQLDTLLLDPDHVRRSESIAALRSFNAILLGGAAPTSHLSATITELKLPVTRTYGMSETAGGCVYDGTALPGVTIKLTPDQRIMLTGPTLASGYLDNPAATAAAFPTINNTRWHLTNDLGTLTGGRLTITGRIDDIINTGGVKVAPAPIDDALLTVPGVTGACTVATPTRTGVKQSPLSSPSALTARFPPSTQSAPNCPVVLTRHNSRNDYSSPPIFRSVPAEKSTDEQWPRGPPTLYVSKDSERAPPWRP